MLILDNFLCELNSHIWPFRLNITFWMTSKLSPGYEIYIISYQVNLSSEVSAMFNSLMPSLNIRSLPFVVFLGGFPSRCQNLSSGAIRPGGLLFWGHVGPLHKIQRYQGHKNVSKCIPHHSGDICTIRGNNLKTSFSFTTTGGYNKVTF